jgi:hypothetical protein
MMENLNWDEIKEQLEKAVKLEKNDDDLSVKIIILEESLEENKMIGNMLKGEDEMKQSLGQFLGNNEPLDCDIDINQDEKYIKMVFKKKKDFKKVYTLLNDIFFGDFFKKMLEAMMGAFGNMFGND